jgi:hypothetical protein
MRDDVVISCRRSQRTMLRRMAAIECMSMTDLLGRLIEARLRKYPAPVRATVEARPL